MTRILNVEDEVRSNAFSLLLAQHFYFCFKKKHKILFSDKYKITALVTDDDSGINDLNDPIDTP